MYSRNFLSGLLLGVLPLGRCAESPVTGAERLPIVGNLAEDWRFVGRDGRWRRRLRWLV